eukprot:Blabericola_migrator_1__12863@NODE_837_length_6317_cov_234_594560_g592_i0_p2_GENE_NODE_837_length_6317_cov_234_594560_g592_i0NODE_837_length_6317_cov_234_594560_g592_i0_p2_ORF_typecomplete_len495_score112_04_NODE_837_length_6317_cov_234_594560_g592_i015383022
MVRTVRVLIAALVVTCQYAEDSLFDTPDDDFYDPHSLDTFDLDASDDVETFWKPRNRRLDDSEIVNVTSTAKKVKGFNINPIMWNITIYHPLAHILGNTQPSTQQPMVCDFVVLTAMAPTTSGGAQALHSYRLDYAKRQSNNPDPRLQIEICLLNFYPVSGHGSLKEAEHKVLKYRAALHTMSMISKHRIVSPSHTSEKPSILTLDETAFLSNINMTMTDVFHRLDLGATYRSAMDQFCNETGCVVPPRTRPQDWVRRRASERYHPDFFLSLGLEPDCYKAQPISTSALLIKPHPFAKILLEAVIVTSTNELGGVPSTSPVFEQANMRYVLTELFDFDFNKTQQLCWPYKQELWDQVMTYHQYISESELNRRNLELHPLFQVLHKKYSKVIHEMDKLTKSWDKVLLLHPRELSSSACPQYLRHMQRSALAWHPQDFIARFDGCDPIKALRSDPFKDKIERNSWFFKRSVIGGGVSDTPSYTFTPLSDPDALILQ